MSRHQISRIFPGVRHLNRKQQRWFEMLLEIIKLPRLVEAVDFLEFFWKSTSLIDKGPLWSTLLKNILYRYCGMFNPSFTLYGEWLNMF